MHHTISAKYCGPSAKIEEYHTAFNSESDIFLTEVLPCKQALSTAQREFLDDLALVSPDTMRGAVGDKKDIDRIGWLRSRLLSVTDALQDLLAHVGDVNGAIAISAITTKSILQGGGGKTSEDFSAFKILSIDERYRICKLIFLDASLMSRLVAAEMVISVSERQRRQVHGESALRVLDACRCIYNIRYVYFVY